MPMNSHETSTIRPRLRGQRVADFKLLPVVPAPVWQTGTQEATNPRTHSCFQDPALSSPLPQFLMLFLQVPRPHSSSSQSGNGSTLKGLGPRKVGGVYSDRKPPADGPPCTFASPSLPASVCPSQLISDRSVFAGSLPMPRPHGRRRPCYRRWRSGGPLPGPPLLGMFL